MCRQPFRRAHLIRPTETTRAVSCELNVVRRICVNEILGFDQQPGDIGAGKSPIANDCAQRRKIARVVDRFVTSKGRVECAALIKAAKAVKAGAVQVVEDLRGFGSLKFSGSDQTIEAITMGIKKLCLITHLNPHLQTALHLNIKIDEMWIEIVQDRALWLEAHRGGQPVAK